MSGTKLPVKVVQFGEGNFLRAFIDWMVQVMNHKAGFGGSVAIVKVLPGPLPQAFDTQDCAYHLVLKGNSEGKQLREVTRIESVSRTCPCYEDFEGFLGLARNPDLKVLFSNTTEAGIAWVDGQKSTDTPAASFPAKFTQFLHERYTHFAGARERGVLILPCELIEKNGATLREFTLRHAAQWYGDAKFEAWLGDSCTWYDTLVDRIVPGYDAAERAALKTAQGVDDELVVVAEPYHLFVIQGPEREDVLPFRKSGLNAVWTDDLVPFRSRKVRVLNGGHTFLALTGLELGLATVRDGIEHKVLGQALSRFYRDEVLPFLHFPQAEREAYLKDVLERFGNPLLDHKLESIALNSLAKFITRVMPSVTDYENKYGTAPVFASLALAVLIVRYLRDASVPDDERVKSRFRAARESGESIASILADAEFWKPGSLSPVFRKRTAELATRLADTTLVRLLEELNEHK